MTRKKHKEWCSMSFEDEKRNPIVMWLWHTRIECVGVTRRVSGVTQVRTVVEGFAAWEKNTKLINSNNQSPPLLTNSVQKNISTWINGRPRNSSSLRKMYLCAVHLVNGIPVWAWKINTFTVEKVFAGWQLLAEMNHFQLSELSSIWSQSTGQSHVVGILQGTHLYIHLLLTHSRSLPSFLPIGISFSGPD